MEWASTIIQITVQCIIMLIFKPHFHIALNPDLIQSELIWIRVAKRVNSLVYWVSYNIVIPDSKPS